MRQALADCTDTAAAGQDDRPAAGGDVDMVDQGAHQRWHSRAHLRPCRSPGCNHHRRTARDAPASKRLAPWVPHHIWKRARLTHTARGAPGSRTARGPAHGVPRIGLARVQTAFSTSRTSEVPADLRMGES